MASAHQTRPMSVNVTAGGTTLTDQIAEEIRSWMGRRQMSQAELSRQLNVSKMWVSYRLSGTQPIDVNDLDRIASVLGVGVVDLLPRSRREVTSPYLPPSAIPMPRNPLKGIGDPQRTGRTGRTMADPSISQAAQRASARASRQLQPCG